MRRFQLEKKAREIGYPLMTVSQGHRMLKARKPAGDNDEDEESASSDPESEAESVSGSKFVESETDSVAGSRFAEPPLSGATSSVTVGSRRRTRAKKAL
jgi:hypothetical protein